MQLFWISSGLLLCSERSNRVQRPVRLLAKLRCRMATGCRTNEPMSPGTCPGTAGVDRLLGVREEWRRRRRGCAGVHGSL